MKSKLKFAILIIVFGLFGFENLEAQVKAVTEIGDTIYVYNDGTWSYDLNDDFSNTNQLDYLNDEISIDTINTTFFTPPNSESSVSNNLIPFTIHYDNKKWKRIPPGSLNEDAEFAFQHRELDIYSIVIPEETTIDSDMLLRIARKTMEENTGSSTSILKAELRKVNNSSVVRGVLNSKYSGISFIFDSYYYSNENGSVQFTVWTSDKVWKREEEEILELLNGFETR